jgi:hypothetical protein
MKNRKTMPDPTAERPSGGLRGSGWLVAGAAALVLVILCVAGLTATPASADEIRASETFPTCGRPTFIHVTTPGGAPVQGAQVTVVYRPGSEVESTESLGTTDASGRHPWTPLEPGIACLSACWSDSTGDHLPTTNVSVRFHRIRADGLVVAILAGLILYGTAAFGFARLRS